MDSAFTQQINALVEQGLSPEDICNSFKDTIDGITPEMVQLAILSSQKKKISADQLKDNLRLTALNFLGGVLENPDANEMVKVKAAIFLADPKGCMPSVDASDVAAMFKRMQELKEANTEKILVLPVQKEVAA